MINEIISHLSRFLKNDETSGDTFYYKIAIKHSADIECTKEPYNFLRIDTTLPASDSLRFRKNLFDFL